MHFCLSSANWCGSRPGSGSSLLLWMPDRILIFIICGSGCGSRSESLFDAAAEDADPYYQNDADPCGSGCGSWSEFLYDADADTDADPCYQNDADPCGSGSTQHWLQLNKNVPELPTHPVGEAGSLGGLREGKTSTKQEHDAPRESKYMDLIS